MYFTGTTGATARGQGGLCRGVDRDSSGRIYSIIVNAGALEMSWSDDGGKIWSTPLTIPTTPTHPSVGSAAMRVGLYIDQDNYIHIMWTMYGEQTLNATIYSGDYTLYYRRGILNTARDDIAWSADFAVKPSISLSTGYSYVKVELIVVKYLSGWRGAVIWSESRSDPALVGAAGTGLWAYFVPLTITGTTSTACTVGGTTTLFSYSGTTPNGGFLGVDFKHNGDGKTSADTTPHLYVAFDAETNYDATVQYGIVYKKGTFSSGAWSWSASVTLDAAGTILYDVMRAYYVGGIFHVITTSNTGLVVLTRDEANTTTTRDVATGTSDYQTVRMNNTDIYMDSTKKVYAFMGPNNTNGALSYVVWDQAAKVWSTPNEVMIWYGRTGSSYCGVSRYHPNDRVDLSFFISTNLNAYANIGAGFHTFTNIKGQTPSSPSIISPTEGQQLNGTNISIQTTIGAGTGNQYYSLFFSPDDGTNYYNMYISQSQSTSIVDKPLASGSTDTFAWDAINKPRSAIWLKAIQWDSTGNISNQTVPLRKFIRQDFYPILTPAADTLTYSGKRIDKMADGTLWLVISNTSNTSANVIWYYSKDNGRTWITTTNTGAAVPSGRILSIYIDADDFIHFVSNRSTSNSLIVYLRGVPNANHTAWDFGAISLSAISNNSWNCDVVAHRAKNGGWIAHVISGTVDGIYYNRITIATDGTATAGTTVAIVTGVASIAYGNPSIDFYHTGDGKTVKNGTPHVFIMWTHNSTGTGKGVRYKKATYDSVADTWTWGAEVEVDNTCFIIGANIQLANNTTWGSLAFNGSKVLICGTFKTTASSGSGTFYVKLTVINPDTNAIEITYTFESGSITNFAYGGWSYDSAGIVYIYGTNSFFNNTDFRNIRETKYNTITNSIIGGNPIGTVINYTSTPSLISSIFTRKNGTGAINALLLERYFGTTKYGMDSYTVFLSSPPNLPVHNNITNLGYTVNKRPKFFFQISNPDAAIANTNMQVQISTDSTFATTLLDIQYGSDSGYGTTTAGWSGLPTANGANTVASWVPQADLPTNASTPLYLRAKTKATSGDWSVWSATQSFYIYPEPWADVLTPNLYGFKAVWMNDLSTVINNARQFRGLATTTFTDGTITAQSSDVKAIHTTERRSKLGEVLVIVGVTPTWTDTTPVDKNTQHVIELRNYCKQT